MRSAQNNFTAKPILNWLNENEYNFNKKTSLKRWAWEFLRRNPDYQKDHADLCAAYANARANGVNVIMLTVYIPPKSPNETEAVWIARCGSGRRIPLGKWYCQKWKLRGAFLPDPFKEYGLQWSLMQFYSSPILTIIMKNWDGFDANYETKCTLESVKIALAFDLSMPVAPQIDAAYSELKTHQKRLADNGLIEKWPLKNAALQSYPLYLRLLDAKLAGVNDDEISQKIKGDQGQYGGYNPLDSMRKSINKALEIRDGNYWAIPMLGK